MHLAGSNQQEAEARRAGGGAPWPPNLDLSRQLMHSPATTEHARRIAQTHRRTSLKGFTASTVPSLFTRCKASTAALDAPQSVAKQAVQTPHAVHRFRFGSCIVNSNASGSWSSLQKWMGGA